MKRLISFLGFILILTSCAITTQYVQPEAPSYEAVEASQVKIYSSMDIGQSYDVLGNVAVDMLGDGRAAKSVLQEEAAEMGANAVIGVKLTKMNTFAQRTGLAGIAVRIKTE